MGERLKFGTKVLSKLTVGNLVSVQNQTGPRAKKWDKTGVIVEVLKFDQYRVKMDGSGQVTLRNRQYLRKLANGDTPSSTVATQPLPPATTAGCGYLAVGPHGGRRR